MSRQVRCCPPAGAQPCTLPSLGRLQESGLLEGRSYLALLYPGGRGNGSPTNSLETYEVKLPELSRSSIGSLSEILQFSKITTPKSPSPAPLPPAASKNAAPSTVFTSFRCAPQHKMLRNTACQTRNRCALPHKMLRNTACQRKYCYPLENSHLVNGGCF